MLRTVMVSQRPSYLVKLTDEDRFKRMDKPRAQILTDLEPLARCFQVGVEILSDDGHHERVFF